MIELATRLAALPGVVGVVLGGSRARGTHTPQSDTDLGLYYRPPLDTAALGALAKQVGGSSAEVTEPGGWGPWVDGGGWLTIDGGPVDWIYRDLDRVDAVWADARCGRYAFHQQAGHPLGFADFAYAGELAISRILADPTGELTARQQQMRDYPPALAEALVTGLWEAEFLASIARKAVSRADSVYLAGCLFRLVLLCAHALHGAAGQWLINEKGAIAAAPGLPGFRARAESVVAAGDIDAAVELVRDTRAACAKMMR